MIHQFYKYSITRDPTRSFVFLIPETDRLFIVDPGKYLEDEENNASNIDLYKTRHKDTSLQKETKTLVNIKKWLEYNNFIYNENSNKNNAIEVKYNTIQRGDMIQLEWIEYRNDGSYFWDGDNVIQLNYCIDDYGSTPTQFSFPEFPFRYFENRIAHNNLINLSEDLMEKIKNNITFDTFINVFPDINIGDNNCVFLDDSKGIVYSSFQYNEEIYTILGVPDSIYDCFPLSNYKEKFIDLFKKGLNDKYITFEWEGLSKLFNNRVLFNIC